MSSSAPKLRNPSGRHVGSRGWTICGDLQADRLKSGGLTDLAFASSFSICFRNWAFAASWLAGIRSASLSAVGESPESELAGLARRTDSFAYTGVKDP